jgi:hypothetical protein
MTEDFVLVNFEGGSAEFDIHVSEPAQVFTVLLGLEGWLATQLGLDAPDIREILDEMKGDVNVRPKDEEVEDAIPID